MSGPGQAGPPVECPVRARPRLLRPASKHRERTPVTVRGMSRLLPHRAHEPLGADDVLYVESAYLPLEEIARREGLPTGLLSDWVTSGRIPRPAYVLPDGRPMFPPDLLSLVSAAGGVAQLADHFSRRLETARRLLGEPETGAGAQDWEDYLSGEYGVCLRQVTPETVVLKETLVQRIEGQLADPRPEEPEWRRMLAARIDGLDALLRPFARVDPARFGRPTSRERLVEAPRQRWEWLAQSQSSTRTWTSSFSPLPPTKIAPEVGVASE
jgi:Family of unknown function (DUF6058)